MLAFRRDFGFWILVWVWLDWAIAKIVSGVAIAHPARTRSQGSSKRVRSEANVAVRTLGSLRGVAIAYPAGGQIPGFCERMRSETKATVRTPGSLLIFAADLHHLS